MTLVWTDVLGELSTVLVDDAVPTAATVSASTCWLSVGAVAGSDAGGVAIEAGLIAAAGSAGTVTAGSIVGLGSVDAYKTYFFGGPVHVHANGIAISKTDYFIESWLVLFGSVRQRLQIALLLGQC